MRFMSPQAVSLGSASDMARDLQVQMCLDANTLDMEPCAGALRACGLVVGMHPVNV
jgi:hypothetical protein